MMNYGAVVSYSMYFEPGYPKYKEAGVVTGAVLFAEINPLKPN